MRFPRLASVEDRFDHSPYYTVIVETVDDLERLQVMGEVKGLRIRDWPLADIEDAIQWMRGL